MNVFFLFFGFIKGVATVKERLYETFSRANLSTLGEVAFHSLFCRTPRTVTVLACLFRNPIKTISACKRLGGHN